ncbi:MAG TPA: UPF0182 family protein [Oculatellaceae cyanobacterium]|jgi:uncharacterized membrane protein (UPF0182 family)
MLKNFWKRGFGLIALLLGLWLVVDLVSHLVAEIFWFEEVGYLTAFRLRLKTQFILGAIAFLLTAAFLLGNLILAARLQYPCMDSGTTLILPNQKTLNPNPHWQEKFQEAVIPKNGITWRWLLPIVMLLSLLLGLMLLYYGQIILGFWHNSISVNAITPSVPSIFEVSSIFQQLQNFKSKFPVITNLQQWQQVLVQIGQLFLLVGFILAIAVNHQFVLIAIAVILSLFYALVLSSNWSKFLLDLNPTTFNTIDPLFKHDISFYIFSLPVWELLDFWLSGLLIFALIAVALTYLLSGNSLSEGKFIGFSQQQLRHLCGICCLLMLEMAFHHWLARYQLLYSTRGVTYGANYTEVAVQLRVNTALVLLSSAIALLFLWQMLFLRSNKKVIKPIIISLGLFLALSFTGNFLFPRIVQRLVVQPNEILREKPYIERSIAMTRKAFALDNIEVKTFNPDDQLTYSDIQKNKLTIDNIRLWDTLPLLKTNQQLQQIRAYYQFLDADIDRYNLKVAQDNLASKAQSQIANSNPKSQQVIIAPRELNYNSVPTEAKTWINNHLIYTHGYGFTISPVNTVGAGGLPDYFVKDIGISINDAGTLKTSDESIENSIPIGKPRIYYGELTNNYVMTSTRTKELDYPSGDENVYNIYDGNGGVKIGAWWQQLLFAEYLKDWQMLLTWNFTPETKLLFRRNITERIQAIAPFLRFDSDPYLVVADANPDKQQENYLYWIVDAYTTSDRYPYSDPGKYEFNYIRNSVKVVIDAYNGSANFYVTDPQDPIINSWTAIFPKLFKPLNTMPVTLKSHIRYPLDLFSTQSERLLTYHMTDTQVFYNREDQWRIPNEIYGDKPRAVEPYYLIMKLPTAESEEFVLLLPFTPIQRNNLIAWMAARSDGKNYGKLLLYQFPKQELIYGTEQIEARINQDPVISQQISLWNRQGSRALQGNLLVIPIEQSLLYVEPLYLEAEQNSLPTLVRVIVVYENRIVMAETLEKALQAIFQPAKSTTPAIVRPVE